MVLSLLPVILRPDLYRASPPSYTLWIGVLGLLILVGFGILATVYGLYGAYQVYRGRPFRYMLIGRLEGDNRPPAAIMLGDANFSGGLTMSNGLTRLATRFLGEPESVERAKGAIGRELDAEAAGDLGLVTFALDDIDWEDEIRMFLEERASFSPDGLTGMEANLRFGGPETMETKIFARLTAWQNWIFQRPNAAGAEGALKRYGSGVKANFNPERV